MPGHIVYKFKVTSDGLEREVTRVAPAVDADDYYDNTAPPDEWCDLPTGFHARQLGAPKPDPYNREPPRPDVNYDMLVTEAMCGCCRSELPRGTIAAFMRPKGKLYHVPNCGPCAARIVLPLWDEHEAWRRRRVK